MPDSKRNTHPRTMPLDERYMHRGMPRREFMHCLAGVLGHSWLAAGALGLLASRGAQAARVAGADPGLESSLLTFGHLDTQALSAYLAWPKGRKNLPAAMVIHGDRGLNSHVRDFVRKLALSGFLVLAPDYLSGQAGVPVDEGSAREAIRRIPAATALSVSRMAQDWLQEQGNGGVSCLGFGWGGGQALALAARSKDLKAVVSYYGAPLRADQVPDLGAAVLLHDAGLDGSIDAGIDRFEMALLAYRKTYELYRYAGVHHAFSDPADKAHYDRATSDLAWQRTLVFLARYHGR